MTEKTINEKLDEMIALQNEKSKKNFRLPLAISIMSGQIRKNYCLVLFINDNGGCNIKFLPIEDSTVKIGENYYDASAGNFLRYKKYPLLIITSWDMKPFNPKENFDNAERTGTLTSAEKLILTKMKMEAIKPKLGINMKTVLLILVVVGVGYFAGTYFGWF